MPPPPPLRGGYAFTGVEYGDQVTYDCECGYDLDGDQVLTCETGDWGEAPCCRSKWTASIANDLLKIAIYHWKL